MFGGETMKLGCKASASKTQQCFTMIFLASEGSVLQNVRRNKLIELCKDHTTSP